MKPTFIIAEAGVNHDGSLEQAKALITVASLSGADAVKFQTFNTHQLVTEAAPKAHYQTLKETSSSQYEMLKKLELSVDDHLELIKHCNQQKIQFLSTPFDLSSLDLLATLNVPILKIASGEITNAPLLLKAARMRKPLILSTGMSTLADIEMALSILAFGYTAHLEMAPSLHDFMTVYCSIAGQQALQNYVTLLHCTTEYPAPYDEVNLKALETLKQAFHLPIGYSDHTKGIEIAIAAVARGASVIEKHFTLDNKLPGPDHASSLEPDELARMIRAIRNVELAIGDGYKVISSSELKNRLIARKSLVALCPIQKGEHFTENNLGIKRPGHGIPGLYYWDWLGKTAQYDYHENQLIVDI